jgi:hypothetical protein
MLARVRKWLHRNKLVQRPFYERTEYTFDGTVIRARDPLGTDRSICVSLISDVGIETNSLGPFVEDVFLLLNREAEAIRIPQCSSVFNQLLEHFKSFEGFDWDAVGRSMTCTKDAFFACWSRKPKNKGA